MLNPLNRNLKKAVIGILYFLIPPKLKRNVAKHFFQPALDKGIADRVIRKFMNIYYSLLDDAQKDSFYRDFWGGEAGTGWIEFKRNKYKKGEMGDFIAKIRGPFVKMVIDFLQKNNNCKLILDVGTGPGELIFELFSLLGPGYKFIGIDLNSRSIEENINRARKAGFSKSIDFICADILKWLEDADYMESVLLTSVAAMRYFTPSEAERFFVLLKKKCKSAVVALYEEISCGYSEGGDSLYIGNLSFAHNYEELFKKIGYKINTIEIKKIHRDTPKVKHLYAIAYF